MAHRDEGWRWVACVFWDWPTRLGSGSGLAWVIEHDLANTFVPLESQVKGLAEHATVLSILRVLNLHTASARIVVAFPLEYSPKVYQSVDQQRTT